MKKRYFVLLACLLLLLCGCEDDVEAVSGTDMVVETTEATIPPDGKSDNVTCKGSYTAQVDTQTVVARVGEAELTNGELQVWYWAEVAQYRQTRQEYAPDFEAPLDSQKCEIDESVASWQQYFLKRALNAWHSAQALMQQGEDEGLPTEEAYQPREDYYETYMDGKPATKVLYGYSQRYEPNSMHQEYLDNLPEMLDTLAEEKGYADAAAMAAAAFGAEEADVLSFAQSYNYGYMYFTSLSYYIEPTTEEIGQYRGEHEEDYTENGSYVDIRHILLVPDDIAAEEGVEAETVAVAADGTVTCSETAWEACEIQATELLEYWTKKTKATEATFADLANKNSEDSGSALNGGSYRQIRKGQLIPELDSWCFDAQRQAGDTAIIRSDYGYHILYFSGSTEIRDAEAERDLREEREVTLICQACSKYPMEVDYSAITLGTAEGTVSTGDVLYADVAHERFPEVPLYLQQDYPNTMYGNYKITTNGCGITTLAMLASYMADDELTPPELCARYGSYSFNTGTDGSIFEKEPASMGFYLIKKSYDWREARDYMEEGHIVVVVQYKGYWTGGGHYLVLEKLGEDGRVQVRDSNIYNYAKLGGHQEDLFHWDLINPKGMGYWIYEHKVTSIPACARCGEPEGVTDSLLLVDYCCEKCGPALLRRNTYLTGAET